MIQQGLLVSLRWREAKCLLNLKDLLAMLQRAPERLFKNWPILRPPFLCRIV